MNPMVQSKQAQTEEPIYTESERNEFAIQQADLAFRDAALQTAIDTLIKVGSPAWVVETMLAIREEYGLSNDMYKRAPDQPQE